MARLTVSGARSMGHLFQIGSEALFPLKSVDKASAQATSCRLFLRQCVIIVDRSKFGWEHLGQLVGDALAHLHRDLDQGTDLLPYQRFWRTMGMLELQQSGNCLLDGVLVAAS